MRVSGDKHVRERKTCLLGRKYSKDIAAFRTSSGIADFSLWLVVAAPMAVLLCPCCRRVRTVLAYSRGDRGALGAKALTGEWCSGQLLS